MSNGGISVSVRASQRGIIALCVLLRGDDKINNKISAIWAAENTELVYKYKHIQPAFCIVLTRMLMVVVWGNSVYSQHIECPE